MHCLGTTVGDLINAPKPYIGIYNYYSVTRIPLPPHTATTTTTTTTNDTLLSASGTNRVGGDT